MILITGATGNIGRDLISQLLEKGQSLRALTRDPSRSRLPSAVDVRAGDLSDAASLAGLFDGVDKAFLLLHVPGDPAQCGHFLRGAKAAGVRHLVVVSSLSAEQLIPGDPVGEGHRELEREIAENGIPATVLRAGTFASNTLFWADQARTQDVIRGMDFAPAAVIDPWDIAAVAAVALTEPGHENKIYGLTGGERIDTAEQVSVIGEVLGKPLRFEALPIEALRQYVQKSSKGHGDPDAIIRAVSGPDVPWAQPRPTVRELTGRAPRTFRQWAQAHADAFR